MDGFLPAAGLEYSAATPVCDVVRYGFLLPVGRLERRRGEAGRSEAGRSEPEWIAQDLLRHVNTSGEPEPRQERNYSRDENQPVLASNPEDPPAVSVTTIRRLV